MRKARALEAATRREERKRVERRKSLLMLMGIVLLMIGGVVADLWFIGAQKRLHHQRYHQQPIVTNRSTNPIAEPTLNTNRTIAL